MGFSRNLKRQQLKEQWKLFKKGNKQYKNMPFSQFRKLWQESLLNAAKQEVAPVYTDEQETELADMLVEEVFEDEDPVTE